MQYANPKYSFETLGLFHDIHVIYTCTARAENIVTEEDLAGLVQLIEANKTKRWLWVLDFHEMSYSKMMTLSFISRLVTYLKTEHATNLTQIWIVNMNYWVHTILSYFVTAKVRMISEDSRQNDMVAAMIELGFPFIQQNRLLTSLQRTFGAE
jgi:hypothetical protein